jgi:hypothetical protein
MRKSWPSTKRKLFWMRQAASVVSDFEWSGRAPPVYLSRGVITSVEKKTWATATILVVLAMMMRTDSSHLAVFELRTWSTNILLLAVTEGVKQRVRLETSV